MKQKLLIFLIFNGLFFAISTPATAQTRRKFRQNELVRLSGVLKVEILNCIGEGNDEVCEVIYYTTERQKGRRVAEQANKIRGEQQRLKDSILAVVTKAALAVNEEIYKENKLSQLNKVTVRKADVISGNNKSASTSKILKATIKSTKVDTASLLLITNNTNTIPRAVQLDTTYIHSNSLTKFPAPANDTMANDSSLTFQKETLKKQTLFQLR